MKKSLAGKEVILCVTGGIAAYKSAELVRSLKERGAQVTVAMTEAATRFIGPLTFGALSGRQVCTGLFDEGQGRISHIELTAKADIFVVAPATANIIGKAASGIADDIVSTLLVAAKCPVLMAPAMNCRMYDNPILRRNIETLKGAGIRFVGPDEGPMACNEYGWGRMSEPADILAAVESIVSGAGPLLGYKVLVTAGPTVEDIDPVRFIGNRSSGRMGYALARQAASLGAHVTLVSGPTAFEPPVGVEMVHVRSATEMKKAVDGLAAGSDIIIMAAAVSDYAPEKAEAGKIKKGAPTLTIRLVMNPDILKGLGEGKKKGQVLVGFAAETEDLEKNALKKLKEKKLDLIAANPVDGGRGFGGEHNSLRIYGRKGLLKDTGVVTKDEAARALLGCILRLM